MKRTPHFLLTFLRASDIRICRTPIFLPHSLLLSLYLALSLSFSLSLTPPLVGTGHFRSGAPLLALRKPGLRVWRHARQLGRLALFQRQFVAPGDGLERGQVSLSRRLRRPRPQLLGGNVLECV
jgi:hypothetical protein